MEVSEGTTPALESDMGFPHADAISTVRSTGRNSLITMAGRQHICIGDAKVRSPLLIPSAPIGRMLIILPTSQILLLGTFKTANADDAE